MMCGSTHNGKCIMIHPALQKKIRFATAVCHGEQKPWQLTKVSDGVATATTQLQILPRQTPAVVKKMASLRRLKHPVAKKWHEIPYLPRRAGAVVNLRRLKHPVANRF